MRLRPVSGLFTLFARSLYVFCDIDVYESKSEGQKKPPAVAEGLSAPFNLYCTGDTARSLSHDFDYPERGVSGSRTGRAVGNPDARLGRRANEWLSPIASPFPESGRASQEVDCLLFGEASDNITGLGSTIQDTQGVPYYLVFL